MACMLRKYGLVFAGALKIVRKYELSSLKRSDDFSKIERRPINKEQDLTSRSAKTLFKWWSSFAPSVPSRVDFDILNLTSIASDVYLVSVISSGRYMYRLGGERVAGLVGRRQIMTEISTESENLADAMFAKYLSWTIGAGGVNGCLGSLEFFGKDFLAFESIDCPLVDASGKTTHIIGTLCQL